MDETPHPHQSTDMDIDPPQATAVLVTGPAGQQYDSLPKGMDAHLKCHYPKWREETYFVPPFTQPPYKGPQGSASGAPEELSQGTESRMTGWKAETKVFKSIEKFAEGRPQPMIAFTDFKWRQLQKPFVDKTRETDCLIVHRELGVIIMEIKNSFESDEVKRVDGILERKSCKQLEISMKNIKESPYLLGGYDPAKQMPQITLVHIYPNDPRERIDSNSDGKCQCGAFQLGKEYFDDPAPLHNWFQSRWNEQPADAESANSQAHEWLVPRLMIPKTGVKAYIEGYKHILKQTHLKDAAREWTKAVEVDENTMDGGPSEGSPRICPEELRRLDIEWKFLNPEQLAVWEGPKRMMIKGAYGTGKTILLRYKALERINAGENVVVYVPSPLSEEYKRFFLNQTKMRDKDQTNQMKIEESKPDNMEVDGVPGDQIGAAALNGESADPSAGKCTVVSTKNKDALKESFENVAQSGLPLNVFVDECTAEMLQHVEEFISRKELNYFWVVPQVLKVSLMNFIKREMPLVDSHIERTMPDASIVDLQTVMRYTEPIYRLLQDKSGILDKRGKLGHNVQGPKPEGISSGFTDIGGATLKAIEHIKRLLDDNIVHQETNSVSNSKTPYTPGDILFCFEPNFIMFGEDKLVMKRCEEYMKIVRKELDAAVVPTCSLEEYAKGSPNKVTCAMSTEELLSFEWKAVVLVACGFTDKNRDGLIVKRRETHSSGLAESFASTRCMFDFNLVKYWTDFQVIERNESITPQGDEDLVTKINSIFKITEEDANEWRPIMFL